jgi:hypothetical protein
LRLESRVAITVLAMLVLSVPPAIAQTVVTGEIAGTVTDPSGGLVANAGVVATSEAYGDRREVTTNAEGEYRIPLLPPGIYHLSATSRGFQPMEVKATVSLGAASVVPIKLAVETVSTVVDVTGDAPLLATDNANQATTLSRLQIEELPIPGNDLTAYAFIAPGATLSTGGGYGSFSSFGLPATSNLVTVNGNDILDPYVNITASGASNLALGANEMLEGAVVSNGYTGQYGRQAGAQVNYVTKSGTNAYHGNASWLWNGSSVNANDYFNNSTGTERPHAVSNQWATSFGGPAIRNKLFYFVDQEGLRYVLPGGGPIYIPTTDFANYVLNNLRSANPAAVPFYTKVFDLYGGASGASRATPVTSAEDPALGCGNFSGGGFGTTSPCARKFQSTVNNLNTEWLLTARADYNINASDHVYFRFNTDHGVQATGTDAINPVFNANSVQPAWGGQIGYTRTMSPASVNDLRLSGSYNSSLFGPPDLAAARALFPTTMTFSDGSFSQLGGGANSNPAGTGLNNFPSGRNTAQWQIIDDYAWTHGAHTLKAGVNFRRIDFGDYSYGVGASGLLNFLSTTDFVNATLKNGSFYAQRFARIGSEHIGMYGLGLYVQDQWTVKPTLTITASLRFDRASNPSCGRNCFDGITSTFQALSHDVNQPYNSAIRLGLGNAFRNLDPIIVQPRIGVAYTLNSKTVLRGGVGLFSDQFLGALVSRFFTNTPNVANFTATSGIVAPGVLGSAFANVAASNAALQSEFSNGATLAQLTNAVPGFAPPSLYTQANQFHVPTYAEWNFEIQRELNNHLTWSENYAGNHGWHEINQNPFLNSWSPSGFGGLPTATPDARFGEINQLESKGHSNYSGLVSSLRWRLNDSFVGQVNYTYSHALDTCSNNCLAQFNLQTAPSYRYQLNPSGVDAGNYGSADYDVRHSLNMNFVWNIPARYQNHALRMALGGWTVSGTLFTRSGYPFSIVNSTLRGNIRNSSGVATMSVLADWIGGSASTTCGSPVKACFSSSEFASASAQSDFGNLRRNAFRGPDYFDTDLHVTRTLLSKEKYRFLIGANLYNLLNHPNFDLPVNNVAAGNFGTILSTVSPPSSPYGSFTGAAVSGRVVQFNARFQF